MSSSGSTTTPPTTTTIRERIASPSEHPPSASYRHRHPRILDWTLHIRLILVQNASVDVMSSNYVLVPSRATILSTVDLETFLTSPYTPAVHTRELPFLHQFTHTFPSDVSLSIRSLLNFLPLGLGFFFLLRRLTTLGVTKIFFARTTGSYKI